MARPGSAVCRPAEVPTSATAVDGCSPDARLTVKLGYKDPYGDASRLVSSAIRKMLQPMTANIGDVRLACEGGSHLRRGRAIRGVLELHVPYRPSEHKHL